MRIGMKSVYYIAANNLMSASGLNGVYYFLHLICNVFVVRETCHMALACFKNVNVLNEIELEKLYEIKHTIYGLHIYHIISYWDKLRRDDIIHHLLMIGVALPLTEFIPQTNLIAHNFFFLNGLPGMIDYLLLFYSRNGIISKNTEKRINKHLNLWIRCPGAIANATLSLSMLLNNYSEMTTNQLLAGMVVVGCTFWNGIYFMEQIVTNTAILND